MKHLEWLWNNIEAILFFIFFATFPFNIRKVFLSKYSYLNGEFNEYLTMSLSWIDLLATAIMIIYTIKWLLRQGKVRESKRNKINRQTSKDVILYNNISNRSRVVPSLLQNFSHFIYNIIKRICQRSKSTLLSSINTKTVSRETFLLFLFISWVLISTTWSFSKEIAFYRALSGVEVAIIAFLALDFARQNRSNYFLIEAALIAGGTIQALIAVSQFVLNKSLGVGFLGESILGPDLPGVAKFTINNVKHIRAYGTLPHPNILAGFLLVPIFTLSSFLYKELKVRKPQPAVSRETITNEISTSLETMTNGISTYRLAIVALLIFMLIGLVATLSRSALLALSLGGFIFGWQKLKSSSLSRKSLWLFILILALFLTGSLVSQTKLNFILSGQSLKERSFYLEVSRETISERPVRGAGIGQFVLSEYNKHPNLAGWQYQPVHNLYLLIFSELGATGFVLFLLFLINIVRHSTKGEEKATVLTNEVYYCLIISFLFLAFFDHYFWDIKPGTITFILPFILYAASYSHQKEKKI